MKVKIGNFILEEERNCCILSEYGIISRGTNEGNFGQIDQTYPSDFIRGLGIIQRRLVKAKDLETDIKGYIEELKLINEQFLEDLKSVEIIIKKKKGQL